MRASVAVIVSRTWVFDDEIRKSNGRRDIGRGTPLLIVALLSALSNFEQHHVDGLVIPIVGSDWMLTCCVVLEGYPGGLSSALSVP